MTNPGKRPLPQDDEERAAKKGKGFNNKESGSSDEAAFGSSSSQGHASSKSYFGLTPKDVVDILFNRQGETLLRTTAITANSEVMKSDAATRGLKRPGFTSQTPITPVAISLKDATSIAPYDVSFGLVIYQTICDRPGLD